MYAAGSIEDFARFYKAQGGVVVSGVWSVLISDSPERSADFARRYLTVFNEVVGSGWHLAVYAQPSFENGTVRWTANSDLHKHVIALRKQITDSGEDVPKLGIIFFDPNIGVFDKKSVIIPLDDLRIGDEGWFRTGFEVTHRCIMKAFEKLKLDPYSSVPPSRVNDLLEEIGRQLRFHTIKSIVTKPLVALGNAGLGALLGAL